MLYEDLQRHAGGIADSVARRPGRWMGTLLLLTAAAAALLVDHDTGSPRLRVDASIEALLGEDQANRAAYDSVRTVFGDTEVLVVAVGFEPKVMTPEHLAVVADLTVALRRLAGVNEVLSLATAPNVVADDFDIDVSTFTQQAARDPGAVPGLEAALRGHPLYGDALVSADGRFAAFTLTLGEMDEGTFRGRAYADRIRETVRAVAGTRPVQITGSAVLKAATTGALLKTLAFVLPAMFGIVIIVLMWAFRSLRATIATVLSLVVAEVLTLAVATELGIAVNLVTAIVPPLVATIGLSYAVYMLSEFFEAAAQAGGDRGRQVSLAIRGAGPSLMLASTTTAIGLLALALSPLEAIRDFAVLGAIGVGFALIVIAFFLPALLAVLGAHGRGSYPPPRRLQALARRLADLAVRRRATVVAIGVAVIAVDLLLASGIEGGSEYIRDFREDAPVRQDFEAINSGFAGATAVTILVNAYIDDALADPGRAAEIDDLGRWLREQPEVGSVVSYVDHVKLLNQALDGGTDAAFRLPRDATAIKQLLIFGGSEAVHRVIDARMRTALISVRITADDSRSVAGLVRRIERRVMELSPPMTARVTGSAVLASRAVEQITGGQWKSLAIAVGAIFVTLALLFTSLSAAFFALLPSLVPITTYFGLLGAADISLTPTTSLIACIVLGIAVDDTIHYLSRFNHEARTRGSEEVAAREALTAVIRPITMTTVALCLGFLVFTGSELRNLMQFGLLAAGTLALAWLSSVTLTPALGSMVRIVTLWDLLRLDLGQNAQHTIPLFNGLSLREARVFALLSRIESQPAGARVITAGEEARDIYMIVDGEMQAWIEREGERRNLTTMQRGATMGEAGFFGQKRTANVDALGPVRLLRFNSDDLERMRTRYPRIAATVFRNLNRIQAERLARTTRMIQ